ncbi:MAG: DUF3313 family protein [Pseudomonadales bacterium]
MTRSNRQGWLLSTALSMVLVFAGGAVSAAETKPPEVDSNGLHLVHDSKLRLVYALPGASLSGYDKVILVDAYVAFRKHWLEDRRETSIDPLAINKKDVEELKQRVADEFKKEMTKELEKKGYAVVDKTETGADVLIVRPAIINLDISAPDIGMASMHTYFVRSAGEMTLYAELYDSVSSQMLVKVIDPEADDKWAGTGVRANEVTNRAAADEIIRKWADVLASHLHEVVKNPK